ncbi:MAG: phasin family protein, partial [Candidatus Dechloromonas phosphoritropha]
ASGKWDSHEKVFEDRVARALSSLGVPSKRDIDRLTTRITELTALVTKMSDAQEGTVAKAAPVRKLAATKSVAARTPAESADATAGAATAS